MENLKPNPANNPPLTPIGFLERAATVYGDCPSVIYNDTVYTWSDTYRRCLRLASSIVVSLGVKRRQVVSVVAPNVPAVYELHFAVPMAGAVLNTLNTRLDSRTISVMLRHGESKLVFVDQQSVNLVIDAISLFPNNAPVPRLVLIADEAAPLHSPEIINSRFYCNYEELVERGDSGFRWLRPETEWDPIILNYTSGTTSSPKGVVHCHRGIFIVTVDSLVEWGVPKQPVILWTLPMFHANGWTFPWGMAAVGGTNICLRKFDGPAIFDLIRRHGVTHMCGAPVVLNMLSNTPNAKALESPVHIMTAGAPPPSAVLHRTEALGFVVSHGYGMTETGGMVTSCAWKRQWNQLPATEQARLKARQGVRTAAMAEVDVVDPNTGLSVKRDGLTIGEVVLKGGCLMLGYLKDPEATAKCIDSSKGWMYTGDVGVMHSDGYLEIKDRSKDVIITGGENVSSVEVESALYGHPAVDEAAVVARPDDYWGESPCAFVKLKNGVRRKPTEKEILEYCREKLPHYMVPKSVVFRDELPKTSTGKIQKFLLKEIAKAMGSTAAEAASSSERAVGLSRM
ncbi:probable acyl-activating enzyme 6 isoform X1 [Morus notabilis]|uniref:probable acyl-activating enzyme 6 isoform X1 n=1 Tax=Morus notabilis TaxID=981085 RepID=UPI000CED6716|nr:probable acyl-activating enzyme 6 isoform X1 [Morus notabilis]